MFIFCLFRYCVPNIPVQGRPAALLPRVHLLGLSAPKAGDPPGAPGLWAGGRPHAPPPRPPPNSNRHRLEHCPPPLLCRPHQVIV